MFIHWGLYAIPAGEWKDYKDHGEWIRTTAQIPLQTYAQFTQEFNPIHFDADEWCRIAKDAGMTYIVITTKHHDGFALFDSDVSTFDVMSTPLARDIMDELASACRRHGLRMCWYHSIMDWNHPDYLPRRGWEAASRPVGDADFDRFVTYLHAQVTELLTKYGDIGVMWFDGEWESTWTHDLGTELYALCRTLQPDVIVNNRVDVGRQGMEGLSPEGFAGDFGTPEQQIPATGLPGVDWETCMTMNRHWGWNRHDTQWKSTTELIRNLVDIASKGGNFLLNVGPRADGTFPPRAVQRLSEIGQWMRVHSESIIATDASPFASLSFGRATVRHNGDTSTLYLHVFEWPADGMLEVPGLASPVSSARLLSDRDAVLPVQKYPRGVRVALPPLMPDERCSVIALEITGTPRIHTTPTIAPASEAGASVPFVGSIDVTLAATSGANLRYTLDGSEPTHESALWSAPIRVSTTCTLKTAAFDGVVRVTDTAEQPFHLVSPHPSKASRGTQPGLQRIVVHGDYTTLPSFTNAKALETSAEITLTPEIATEGIGVRWTGILSVEHDALYRFRLNSDDGSRLSINGSLIIDNNGLHSAKAVEGTAALAAGHHAVTIEWFNRTGGAVLELLMARDYGVWAPIPPDALSHTAP
jgi:alpha-L-fucosidase